MAVVLAAAALTGCDASSPPAREAVDAPPQVLRMRPDAERNRLWVLDHEAVSVYDNVSGRLLGRAALPDWVFVHRQYTCTPDLVVDASGTAFVSSNVIPVLWRIDGVRFEVTRLELALDADRDKDFGFSSLSFASDGTLVAASALAGSLWRIDVGTSAAEKLLSFKPRGLECELEPLLRATSASGQLSARSRQAR